MPYFSKDQIAEARKLDLLTYLRLYEPNELVHFSDKEYCTRTHDSLKISNGKWMWWSKGFGGASALDYLVKVRGKPFAEAVRIINGQEAVRPSVFCINENPAFDAGMCFYALKDGKVWNFNVLAGDANRDHHRQNLHIRRRLCVAF